MQYAKKTHKRILIMIALCSLHNALYGDAAEVAQKNTLFQEAQTNYNAAVASSTELSQKALDKRKEANEAAAAASSSGPAAEAKKVQVEELAALEKEIEDAKTTVKALQDKHFQLANGAKSGTEEEQKKKQAEVDALKGEIDSLVQDIEDLEKEKTDLQEQINEPTLSEKLEKLSQEANEAEKAAQEAAAKIEPLKAKLDTAQQELDVATEKAAEEQRQLEEAAAKFKEIEDTDLAQQDAERKALEAAADAQPTSPSGLVQTPSSPQPEIPLPAPTPSSVPEKPLTSQSPPKPESKPVVSSPVVQKPGEQILTTTPLISIGEGIDTLEEEGGNWLLKRRYLEETIDEIENINTLFSKTLESRMDFLLKRNKIEHDFDIFAHEVGFKMGDLDQLLNTILKDIEKYRMIEGDLNQEERDFVAEIEEKNQRIQELLEKVKNITELSQTVDMVIMQVEEEVNKSHNYQTQAWKNFQAIKKILNDEKAAELYKQTEGLYKNMQAIDKYLTMELKSYFVATIQTLQDSMNTVKADVKTLGEKGIELEKELDAMETKAASIERAGKKAEADKIASQNEANVSAEIDNNGFFANALGSISFLWSYPTAKVMEWWNYILSFFIQSEEPLALAEGHQKGPGLSGQDNVKKIDEKSNQKETM